ncbi:MAG: hypothetical protein SNJ74_10920 [Fimbriimonadaceae bacterium]
MPAPTPDPRDRNPIGVPGNRDRIEGRPQLVAPNRPAPTSDGRDVLGRIDDPIGRRPSRDNSQRSENNRASLREATQVSTIGRAPIDVFSGSLRSQVSREEQIRLQSGRLRVGYFHYDPYWIDQDFWFRGYSFDPWRRPVHCSPWYYYPHLPAYVPLGYVQILQIQFQPIRGVRYVWTRGAGGFYSDSSFDPWRGGPSYRSNRALDEALDDIDRAFNRRDQRALGRLIPARDRIHIFIDGRYVYSLESDTFYEMMMDVTLGTRTRRYEILSVQTNRDEAEVVARHEFIDPWGRWSQVFHWYRLTERRGYYEITRFGTSQSRW